MKTSPPPGYRLVRDWKGLTVRTVRPLRNGLAIIEAGTICTVRSVGAGLCIETGRCAACGVRVLMMRVSSSDVEVIAVERAR